MRGVDSDRAQISIDNVSAIEDYIDFIILKGFIMETVTVQKLKT